MFDLLEVERTLASVLRRAAPGLRLNEHIEADGLTVFAHACKMGLEGIVSKRKDSAYRSGRSPDWLKSKNVNKFFGSALSVALQVMSRQHEAARRDARFRAFAGSHLC